MVSVTGRSTGIGKAAALAFAHEGAAVMDGDIDERAAETVSAIEAGGGRAAWRSTDVAQRAQIDALMTDCLDRFGGLHAAFNNAGVLPPAVPFHEIAQVDFDRIMAVDLKGFPVHAGTDRLVALMFG